jgi:hypothetical protein
VDHQRRKKEPDKATLCNDSDLYVPPIKYNFLDKSPIFGFPNLENSFDNFETKSVHGKNELICKL